MKTMSGVVLCFYCQLWTYFTPFSSAFIVDLEQVNVNWVSMLWKGVFALHFKTTTFKEQKEKPRRVLKNRCPEDFVIFNGRNLNSRGKSNIYHTPFLRR